MDLLEIRKKAREAKEAKAAKAGQPAAGEISGDAPAPELAEQPAKERKGRSRVPRKKKASRRKTADAGPHAEGIKDSVTIPAQTEEASTRPEVSPVGEGYNEEEIPGSASVEGPVEKPCDTSVQEPAGRPGAAFEADIKTVPGDSPGTEKAVSAPVADALSPAFPDRLELLSFMLAGEEYALKMEEAREIIRWRKPTKVPRAPEHIIGIISLRGVILPVFDVKKRLGLGEFKPSRQARIIVVSDGGFSLSGMVVDSITGVSFMSREGMEPPPSVISGNEAEFIEGVGRADDGGNRLLILIKTSRALAA